jgi:hypothetical protein
MNGYVTFYKDKRHEVYAHTSYEAQQKAAAFFKAKRSYDVSVVLCERADKTIVLHNGAEF